jgi:hypothetical protein
MWSLNSQRGTRTSGPKNFQSSAKKDFFNTIPSGADIVSLPQLVWIPATRELRAHLDGLTRTGALVMLTPTGKAYTKRYFNDHWREDANAVGAEDLNFHDNRGTAATLLAEAGATAPEIAEAMTWTVDKAQRVIDAYLARRGVLAANAIQKLEDYRDKAAATGTAGEQKQ